MTRSSSVVRVRIKSGLSAVNGVVTEALTLFSITDNRSADKADDNPSLPSCTSFDILSKFVVSEFSSHADITGTGAVVSEPCIDVTAATAVSGIITIGTEPMLVSSFCCETGSVVSLSEPSMDSRSRVLEQTELILLRQFFFRRSCRFFFSSSPGNKYHSTKDKGKLEDGHSIECKLTSASFCTL